MSRTGILSFDNGDSRLDDGTLLARCAAASPIAAARPFLEGQGCEDGDRIQVEGTDGRIGGVAVFCMDSAKKTGLVTDAVPLAALQSAKKPQAKRTAKKPNAPAKKSSKRKSQKKTTKRNPRKPGKRA